MRASQKPRLFKRLAIAVNLRSFFSESYVNGASSAGSKCKLFQYAARETPYYQLITQVHSKTRISIGLIISYLHTFNHWLTIETADNQHVSQCSRCSVEKWNAWPCCG
jgi:hypothetical protein